MAKEIKKSTNNSTHVTNDGKYIVWAIVVVVLLITLAISLTYAYFSRSVTQNGDDPKTTVTTGQLKTDFLTSEYITNNNAELIDDEDAYTLADKTVFSIARNANNTSKNVYYTLNLVDIDISDNLKSGYLKWRLYNTTNITDSTEPLKSGDFATLTGTTLELYNTKISLPEGETHNYVLMIWLSNDKTQNQTQLLNGSIKGKVEVTAVNS